MKNASASHVPFAQLPIEARVLFAIYASAALARYCSTPLAMFTLAAELDAVWNANRLILCDLSDPCRMTALLESHFEALGARCR
jgi:hypothetical protein